MRRTWKCFSFRPFVHPTTIKNAYPVAFVTAMRDDDIYFARQVILEPDDTPELVGLRIHKAIEKMDEYLSCECLPTRPCPFHEEHP